jgi:hypothetical protein
LGGETEQPGTVALRHPGKCLNHRDPPRTAGEHEQVTPADRRARHFPDVVGVEPRVEEPHDQPTHDKAFAASGIAGDAAGREQLVDDRVDLVSGTLCTASAISCNARSVSRIIGTSLPERGAESTVTSRRPFHGAAPFHQADLQQHDHEQEGTADHRLPVGADRDDVPAVLEDDEVEDELQQQYANQRGHH